MRVGVSSLLTVFTTLALFDVALAAKHGGGPPWRKRHEHGGYTNGKGAGYTASGSPGSYSSGSSGSYTDGATTAVQKVTGREFELVRRYEDCRFSFYDAGLGACGIVNSGSDFIVALNSAQFDSGKYCFKTITITIGGKSAQATVTDRCPGCPFGGLDFSRGLFTYFAAESVGIIHGTWNFNGAAPPAAPPPPPPPPPPPKPVIELPKVVAPPPPPPPSSKPPPPPPPPTPTPEPKPSSTPVPTPSISLDLLDKGTSTSITSTLPSSKTSRTSTTVVTMSTSSSVIYSSPSGTSSTPTPSSTQKPEDHKGCVEDLDIALVHLGAMIVAGSTSDELVNQMPPPSSASVSASPSASAAPSYSASPEAVPTPISTPPV